MVSRGPASLHSPIEVAPERALFGAAPRTGAIPPRTPGHGRLPRVAFARDLNRGVRRRGPPSEGVALCPRPQMILSCTSSG